MTYMHVTFKQIWPPTERWHPISVAVALQKKYALYLKFCVTVALLLSLACMIVKEKYLYEPKTG